MRQLDRLRCAHAEKCHTGGSPPCAEPQTHVRLRMPAATADGVRCPCRSGLGCWTPASAIPAVRLHGNRPDGSTPLHSTVFPRAGIRGPSRLGQLRTTISGGVTRSPRPAHRDRCFHHGNSSEHRARCNPATTARTATTALRSTICSHTADELRAPGSASVIAARLGPRNSAGQHHCSTTLTTRCSQPWLRLPVPGWESSPCPRKRDLLPARGQTLTRGCMALSHEAG
jgi:hypothetical protein